MFYVIKPNGYTVLSVKAFATQSEAESWALDRCGKQGEPYIVAKSVATVKPRFQAVIQPEA